ncbi:Rv3235 family protein [Streptomyces sp. NPDC051684]|uniref:Rv3235 family protein n=1 Tax=Streptomyces sp. NPDC051684 TaxID=3365670 RepID=UPI0037AE9C73
MQKVMNRRGPRGNTRPPGRRDSRRPGAGTRRVPPRVPPHPTELFTQRLLLVLSGDRPLHWFARHAAHQAFDDLLWLVERRALLPGAGPRPTVHGIGHFEPAPGSFEVFARIAVGPRLHALAFRLALGEDRRWRCTAVELGGRPPREEQELSG